MKGGIEKLEARLFRLVEGKDTIKRSVVDKIIQGYLDEVRFLGIKAELEQKVRDLEKNIEWQQGMIDELEYKVGHMKCRIMELDKIVDKLP